MVVLNYSLRIFGNFLLLLILSHLNQETFSLFHSFFLKWGQTAATRTRVLHFWRHDPRRGWCLPRGLQKSSGQPKRMKWPKSL